MIIFICGLLKSISCEMMELKCDEIKSISYYERYYGSKCTISEVTADSSSTFVIRSANNFEYNKIIQDVEFTNSKLYDIPREVFATFQFLKKVQSNGVGIEDINKYNFNYASNLLELRMRSNKIKKLPNSVFSGLPSLQTLDLSSNEIAEIEKNAFSGMESLEYMTLSDNKIVALDDNLFRDLKNLISIRLDSNKLQTIEGSLFASAANLTEIRLDSNEIALINGDDAFSMAKKLKFLNLGNNRLQNIDISGTNLERLWIPYNKFTHLDINKNLKYLYAPYNQLNSINFNGNTELVEIKLRQNNLNDISNFSSLTKIEVLDVSYNPIGTLNISSFARMSDLVKLNLEFTNITSDSLTFGTFAHNVNLSHLDLSYNQLRHIDFNIFTALTQLTHLKIDGNNLTEIPYENIKNHFPKLSLIGIIDNEWNCTYLSSMIKHLKQINLIIFVFAKMRVYNETNVDGIRCVKNNQQPHIEWSTPIEHLDDEDETFMASNRNNRQQKMAVPEQQQQTENLLKIWNKISEIEIQIVRIDENFQQYKNSMIQREALKASNDNDQQQSDNRDMIVQSEVSFIKVILCLMCFMMVAFMLLTVAKFVKSYMSEHRIFYPSDSFRRSTATIQTTMEHVM